MSTHDIVGKGRFTLLTGISGGAWADAAATVSERLGVEIVAHVIGPGRECTDLYDDWARLREIAEDGAILVRPDAHVGWRAGRFGDPAGDLLEALQQILGRAPRAAEARPAPTLQSRDRREATTRAARRPRRASGAGSGDQRLPARPPGRRAGQDARRPARAAVHDQGRAAGGPGGRAALRHQPDLRPGALHPPSPDERHRR